MRVFAPGHGFSQLVTSFVAFESLGIRHVPLSPFRLSFRSEIFVSPFFVGRTFYSPPLCQNGTTVELFALLQLILL